MKKHRFGTAMLSLSVGVLISAVLASFIPASGEERIYRDIIRLHVIAGSDSAEDQALKLSVRDLVLELVSERTEGAKNYGEAYGILSGMLPEIEETARERVRAEGYGDEVEVRLDRERYPVRYYEGYTLPAGEYMSMRIVLGEGQGKNWWCVLFPPLCRASAVGDSDGGAEFYAAGFTPEEYKIIKNESGAKYKVRFKILELLSETFGFDY